MKQFLLIFLLPFVCLSSPLTISPIKPPSDLVGVYKVISLEYTYSNGTKLSFGSSHLNGSYAVMSKEGVLTGSLLINYNSQNIQSTAISYLTWYSGTQFKTYSIAASSIPSQSINVGIEYTSSYTFVNNILTVTAVDTTFTSVEKLEKIYNVASQAQDTILDNSKLTSKTTGWKLLGADTEITPSEVFSKNSNAQIIWVYKDGKWQAKGSTSALNSKLSEQNHEFISIIESGDGFWINVK